MSSAVTTPPVIAGAARLHRAFGERREQGSAALVTYVMGGDPDLGTSRAMALACVDGGADVLEIGVPFSDPVADGPVIQRAAERARAAGTTLTTCLDLVNALRRETDVPIALMGYWNPVLAYGEERFLEDCQEVGVDALIVPDLLPEEAGPFGALARAAGVASVFLLAPTSTAARRAAVVGATTGFVYFVSVTGVTGARKELPPELAAQVAKVREESTVPVAIGFGVSGPEQARSLAGLADGVVVGSAIVDRIAAGGPRKARAERVRRFVASLRRGLDRG